MVPSDRVMILCVDDEPSVLEGVTLDLRRRYVLLEQTLHGSIKALTDALSLTNPAAFGRATRGPLPPGALS